MKQEISNRRSGSDFDMTRDLQINSLDLLIDGERTTMIIAHAKGRFIAQVELTHFGKRSACMRRLFVCHEYRRKGIGRKLVSTAQEMSRQSGCETLSLEVAKDNKVGFLFYRNLGFIVAHEYEFGALLLTMRTFAQ